MTKDRVFQLSEGWFCLVNGQQFGPWACREYAIAGKEVEQRRVRDRLSRRSDGAFTEWFNANFGHALGEG